MRKARKKRQEPVVRIRDLTFAHGERVVFDGIDLDIMPGRVTAIMGPSGTGKTTLLKLIGGQLRPQSGSIRVYGEEVSALNRKALYRLRKRMGMLFQSGALLTDITVFENVAYPMREHTRLPEPLVRDLVLMKLQAVGLRGAAGLMPNELSGGMARRVALARAIALDPMMVLYDEPFTGQDPISMGVLVKLIRELNDVLNIAASSGMLIKPARNRGAMTRRIGSTAIISIPDNCSVAFIKPISAVRAEPARPANNSAVTTGPSSRTSDRATMTPSDSSAPNLTSVL